MMNILVPTDFSENAQNAVDFAQDIAKIHHANITLLFAYSSVYDFAAQAAEYVVEIEKHAKKELKKTQKKGKKGGLHMDYTILQGTLSSAVAKATKKKDYDLIIMGTQGESGIKTVLIGSNTSEVIKESKIPVLAVPASTSFKKIRSITVALELVKEDINYLEMLINLTGSYKLPYHVIHINKNEEKVSLPFSELQALLKDKFPQQLISFEEISAHKVTEGLHEYMEKNPRTLLTMFSKIKTFFEYLFNQSRSAKMALHTTVPLLVLKSKAK